jgi:signal transduction histidine kinase
MASDHPDLPPAGKSDMKEISETARETILAFDEVLWAVNPRNDTLSDLINYVCRHAEDFFDGSSVQCVFDLPPIIPQAMLPTEIRHQAFLAAKEALNNVLKHSHADEVVIKLVLHAAAFELVFHDNGSGFDPGVPSKRARGGSGLENMQERIRGLGGRFECDIQPGQGTRICFFIPVSLETPDA